MTDDAGFSPARIALATLAQTVRAILPDTPIDAYGCYQYSTAAGHGTISKLGGPISIDDATALLHIDSSAERDVHHALRAFVCTIRGLDPRQYRYGFRLSPFDPRQSRVYIHPFDELIRYDEAFLAADPILDATCMAVDESSVYVIHSFFAIDLPLPARTIIQLRAALDQFFDAASRATRG